MRKVNNRRCITDISRKSMLANRKRCVILIIAIALTAMMLTSLFTIGGSMVKSMEMSTMYQVGSSNHAGFKFLTEEEYNTLKKDKKIRDLSYNIIVGNVLNDEVYEDYTELRYTTEDCAKASFSMPTEGRLPVITESMIDIPCRIYPSIWIFLASAAFAWLTVRISCFKPCRVIKKISPMEAVNYSDYSVRTRTKSRKGHRVTTMTRAWENLKRSSGRNVVVILSIALSIIMVNVTVGIVSSFDEDTYVKYLAATDFMVCGQRQVGKSTMLYHIKEDNRKYVVTEILKS